MAEPIEQPDEGFWPRLRRRKVVQWGLAYAACGWGFLQGLEYVSEAFGWPGQLRQVAILALLIGLPVVLVIAWYHGDRGHQRVTIGEFVLLTGLFLVGGGIFWRYAQQVETAPARVGGAATAASREAPPPIRSPYCCSPICRRPVTSSTYRTASRRRP